MNKKLLHLVYLALNGDLSWDAKEKLISLIEHMIQNEEDLESLLSSPFDEEE